ncbi:MAG: Tol-Pal system protein TolB, partial [Proteobacteria bacterium]|nr:Tol-Pal system protein TolB [Pseudomonadota bacterium]
MSHVKRLLGLAVIASALWCAGATAAFAELKIDITRGSVEPMPIAVSRFVGSGAEQAIGADLTRVIASDLERSGLFSPIDDKAFIQRPEAIRGAPRFGDWRQINAEALVSGVIERQTDGRIKVTFQLWDVFAERQMVGLIFRAQPSAWRRVAHKVADQIYKRITGESGYFDTRVVYISESGPATKRIKRLAIMDQDGENHRFLTDGKDL